MAAISNISWTDGTANFWIGCSHAGPGCDDCYAEALAGKRFGIKFGPGEERRKTKSGYADPLRWQRAHDATEAKGIKATMIMNRREVGVPVWVFCNSLSDFFDNEIDPAWRAEAWRVIKACRSLRWQIVTKRLGNVKKMMPDDWDGGPAYDHVGIIGTMVNQQEVDRDVDKLWDMKAGLGVKWIGASIEPQIGPVDFGKKIVGLDWIITGGESKQSASQARAYDLQWAHDLIAQGYAAGVPVFVKQMGDTPVFNGSAVRRFTRGGSDPNEWPPQFRVQQMPKIYDGKPAPIGALL